MEIERGFLLLFWFGFCSCFVLPLPFQRPRRPGWMGIHCLEPFCCNMQHSATEASPTGAPKNPNSHSCALVNRHQPKLEGTALMWQMPDRRPHPPTLLQWGLSFQRGRLEMIPTKATSHFSVCICRNGHFAEK